MMVVVHILLKWSEMRGKHGNTVRVHRIHYRRPKSTDISIVFPFGCPLLFESRLFELWLEEIVWRVVMVRCGLLVVNIADVHIHGSWLESIRHVTSGRGKLEIVSSGATGFLLVAIL